MPTITTDPVAAPSFPIDRIIVGERHRRDLGDIDGLARSIAEVGLLQPIAVTFDGHLIAGERRLRAVELLGWKTIPYTPIPINLDQIVRGEFAENTYRKDFTLSEAVAIKRALEPLEKAAAKERQREGGRSGGQGSGKLPEASKGNAADKAAKATGKARRTLEKAEAVVDAAEAEPERFGKLKEDMDRTGRVNGIYRRLRVAQQAETIRAEPPPLPGNGPYRKPRNRHEREDVERIPDVKENGPPPEEVRAENIIGFLLRFLVNDCDPAVQRYFVRHLPPEILAHRDDIGAASRGELERKDARIDELQAQVSQRDIKIAGLEQEKAALERENRALHDENEELRALLPVGEPGPILACLRRAAP
jgi:ParB-like chromosome segregation protein Spo0J